MKKFLLTLALTAMCAFGFTACGNTAAEEPAMTVDMATQTADGMMAQFYEVALTGATADMVSQIGSYYGEEAATALESDLNSFASTLDEIGEYQGLVEDSVVVTGSGTDCTISFSIKGSIRNATVEMYVKEDTIIPDMMFSPNYTFGEQMAKAGLNTLMGMGTVFAVLILIMFLIQLFAFIPKIEKAIADSKAKKNTKVDTEAAVDNTIAQIIENEELSDDTELVAVIAAAIAAYEGSASTDGVVIRSIKRANTNKWQRA